MHKVALVIALAVPAVALAQPPARDAKELRKICADAMNADPSFADEIVRTINTKIHEDAAEHVVKNERHVILAYGAMWLLAAGFVIFLWRRQQGLRGEIDQLRRELDAAMKDDTKAGAAKTKDKDAT
jgi:CcmD family protein